MRTSGSPWCRVCDQEFVFKAGDQAFYITKAGRCKSNPDEIRVDNAYGNRKRR
jgi:hypothetical protein